MNKNRSGKEKEKRGDNIGKINFWITREETKNFLFGIAFLTFFKK